MHRVTGPQVRRADAERGVDHSAALARAERVLVTAHPAEPLASVALRAGEGALESCLGDGPGPDDALAAALRELLTRHLRERLPDGDAGELHAAAVAAAVVAALELAAAHGLADGTPGGMTAACRARFRAVAPLLPPDP